MVKRLVTILLFTLFASGPVYGAGDPPGIFPRGDFSDIRSGWAAAVVPDGSGGYVVGGEKWAANRKTSTIWAARFDANGKQLWRRRIMEFVLPHRGGPVSMALGMRPAGTIVVAAAIHNDSYRKPSVTFEAVYLDWSGRKIRGWRVPSPNWYSFRTILIYGDGGIVVTGSETTKRIGYPTQDGLDTAYRGRIARFGSRGAVMWDRRFGLNYDSAFYHSAVRPDGGIVAVLNSSATSSLSGNSQIVMVRLDGKGNLYAAKNYYKGGNEGQGKRVAVWPDGTVALAVYDVDLRKKSLALRILRMKPRFFSPKMDRTYPNLTIARGALAALTGGGLAVAGEPASPFDDPDKHGSRILRLGKKGEIVWSIKLDSPRVRVLDLAEVSPGTLVAVGENSESGSPWVGEIRLPKQ